MNKTVKTIWIIAGILFLLCIIMWIFPSYELEILEYNVVGDKEAYVTYQVKNNTNEKVTYRVYASIKKDGQVVAEKLSYIIVKPKDKSTMTVVITTQRNISFYGSKVSIRIEESTI